MVCSGALPRIIHVHASQPCQVCTTDGRLEAPSHGNRVGHLQRRGQIRPSWNPCMRHLRVAAGHSLVKDAAAGGHPSFVVEVISVLD